MRRTRWRRAKRRTWRWWRRWQVYVDTRYLPNQQLDGAHLTRRGAQARADRLNRTKYASWHHVERRPR